MWTSNCFPPWYPPYRSVANRKQIDIRIWTICKSYFHQWKTQLKLKAFWRRCVNIWELLYFVVRTLPLGFSLRSFFVRLSFYWLVNMLTSLTKFQAIIKPAGYIFLTTVNFIICYAWNFFSFLKSVTFWYYYSGL